MKVHTVKILLPLGLFLVISCSNYVTFIPKNDRTLHSHISDVIDGEFHLLFLPIIDEDDVVYNNRVDTSVLCTDDQSLYSLLNIKAVPQDIFLDQVYSCIKNRKAIRVSHQLYVQNEVHIVNVVDSIKASFDAQGKDWLIQKLTPRNINHLYNTDYESFKYLSYLGWENGIYVGLSIETGAQVWYVYYE